MDGEGEPDLATLQQAHYWTQVYSEILEMEEKVLSRIRQLMSTQTAQVQREVELTNVPVVVAQAERFRQRLGYWEARVHELDGHSPDGHSPDGHLPDGHLPDGHLLDGLDGHSPDGHFTDGHLLGKPTLPVSRKG